MNKEQLRKIKEKLTIEKKEFSFFSQKMVNKKYKLFHRDFLPPTFREVLNPSNDNKYPFLYRKDFIFGNPLGFKQNEITDELKERFKSNIEIQDEILRIIKKRAEEFNYRCGIIKVKTGQGKTHICMDIIEYLQVPTLILVTNKKLMSEMIDKLDNMTNYKGMIGQYGDGKQELQFITVMTKTSFLQVNNKDLDEYSCILVDEAHQGFTKDFREKMNTSFDGRDIFLYGLSATPFTNELNEQDLNLYYGKSIEVKTGYDFIPKFTFYNYSPSDTDYEFEHYSELKQLLIDDTTRFEEQKQVILNNLTICNLILTDRLEEAKRWFDTLSNTEKLSYFKIILITGETKIKDDQKQLEEAKGAPTIIIGSTQKVSTGFDYPLIDNVYIFSSIKFEATVIQSVGRGLRKAPGKTGCKVHIWNDKILDKQRQQKQTAIKQEYGIDTKKIENIYIDKKKKNKSDIVLTF